MPWSPQTFASWLDAYGAAWQTRDTAAFAALFTDDCQYYWTPIEPPYVGPSAIGDAFTRAVSTQEGIAFSRTIVAVAGDEGIARWRCTFTRRPEGHPVLLDGILIARAGPDGRCAEFREWWHRLEPAP